VRSDELLPCPLEQLGAWPDQPWEDHTVAKVGPRPGKIFAFPGDGTVSLKVAPADGAELRLAYPVAARDAPYLSKQHWVSAALDGTVPDEELRELLVGSYRLVVAGLPKGRRP